MASLHPQDGARIVLERQSHDAAGADYRVSIYEPNDKLSGGAAGLRDEVRLDWDAPEPDAWIQTFVLRLLQNMPKKYAADATWPRKVTRWRAER